MRDVALVELDEPADDPQQRRLAAAARAEDRHELTVPDVEGDVIERLDRVAVTPDERLGAVADGDPRAPIGALTGVEIRPGLHWPTAPDGVRAPACRTG